MVTCTKHGAYVYGLGSCPECFREVMQQAGERITKSVEAGDEVPSIVRCSKHHRDYNISEGCPECSLSLPSLESVIHIAGEPGNRTMEDMAREFDPNGKKASQLGDCLDEAKKTICGERQDVYGSPEDSFAIIAQYWNTYLTKGSRIIKGPLDAKDVAHMMVLFKMARVQGQRPSRDNYVDLCGYAAIAADRLSLQDSATKKRFEEMVFPKDATWKDGSPGCPHTRTKFVKTTTGDYRQCLGCGAGLEVA